MEIKLDIGKHVFNKLGKYAKEKNIQVDKFAYDMLLLGLRARAVVAKNLSDKSDITKVSLDLININHVVKELKYEDKKHAAILENEKNKTKKIYDAMKSEQDNILRMANTMSNKKL